MRDYVSVFFFIEKINISSNFYFFRVQSGLDWAPR